MRNIQNKPRCWVDKTALRLLRAYYLKNQDSDGRRYTKTLSVYTTICELASNHESDKFECWKQTVSTMSGVPERTLLRITNDLEFLGLVKMTRYRNEYGIYHRTEFELFDPPLAMTDRYLSKEKPEELPAITDSSPAISNTPPAITDNPPEDSDLSEAVKKRDSRYLRVVRDKKKRELDKTLKKDDPYQQLNAYLHSVGFQDRIDYDQLEKSFATVDTKFVYQMTIKAAEWRQENHKDSFMTTKQLLVFLENNLSKYDKPNYPTPNGASSQGRPAQSQSGRRADEVL